jgi:hypothetical protein
VILRPAPQYGVFDCKPLQFIWAKFAEHYNDTNTVMLDDLRRNYVLNPQASLVTCPPCCAGIPNQQRCSFSQLVPRCAVLSLAAPQQQQCCKLYYTAGCLAVGQHAWALGMRKGSTVLTLQQSSGRGLVDTKCR